MTLGRWHASLGIALSRSPAATFTPQRMPSYRPCLGWVGTKLGTVLNYRMVRLRRKVCYPRASQRVSWSGREDLNLRPPAPKAGALPGCATPRLFCFTDSKPLQPTEPRSYATFRCKLRQNCVKTVPKPHQLTLAVSKLMSCSFACRFSLIKASRFICSFI